MKTKTYSPLNWLSLLGLIAILFCCNSAWAGINPTINWPSPANITYGTPLTSSQLNATANVSGSYFYTTVVSGQSVAAAGAVLDTGAHLVTLTFTPDDTVNYNITTTSVNIQVLPSALIATAFPATRVYGQPNPGFQGSVLGLIGTDGVSITFVTDSGVGPGSDVGQYTISAQVNDPLGKSGNYSITLNNSLLTITKAPLSFQPKSITQTYGTAIGNFDVNGHATSQDTVTLIGLYNNGKTGGDLHDDIWAKARLVLPSGQLNDGTIPVLVGGYTVVLDNDPSNAHVNGMAIYGVDVDNGRLTKNYSFDATGIAGDDHHLVTPTGSSVSTGVLTINQKPVTLTGSSHTIPYGQPVSSLAFDGFGQNNILSSDLSGNGIGSIVLGYQSSGVNPGNYTLIPAVTETGTSHRANNYQFSFQTASLTITKLDLGPFIRWSPATPITYGTRLGAAQLNASINQSDDYPAGLKNLAGPGAISYTFNNADANNAFMQVGDNQIITVNFAATPQYNASSTTRSINVIAFTPIITWSNPADITYGTVLGPTQLNATVTGVNDPQATAPGAIQYTPAAGTVMVPSASKPIDQPQNLTAFDSAVQNYNGQVKTVQIKINKGKAVFTQFTTPGLPTGVANVPVSGKVMVGAAPAFSGVSGDVVDVQIGRNTDASDVVVTFHPTINPDGTFSGTTPVTPFDQTKTYYVKYSRASFSGAGGVWWDAADDKIVQLTFGKVTPNFVNLKGANIAYGSWTLNPPTNTVVFSGQLNSASPVPIANGSRTVTISLNGQTVATPLITLDGNGNSVFTSGNINLGSFGLNVVQSPYAVTYSWAGDASFNAVSDTSAQVIVTKIPLSVTPNSVSQPYFTDIPTFTGTSSGLIAADVPIITAVFTTKATKTSPVGQYSITPELTVASGNDASVKLGNYTLTLNSGFLTVTPRFLYVVADNKTVPTNAPLPTLTAHYNGPSSIVPIASATEVVAGTAPNTTNVVTITTTTPHGLAEGQRVAISGVGVGAYNGAFTVFGVTNTTTFTYTNATGNLIASSGGTMDTGPSSGSGFVNGEGPSVINPPVSFAATDSSGAAAVAGKTADYTITPSGGSAVNYLLRYVPGTLHVAGAGPVITWASPSDLTYGTPLSAAQLNAVATVGNPPVADSANLPITYSVQLTTPAASTIAASTLPGATEATPGSPNIVTITTTAPHGLWAGLSVNIVGVPIAGYNGTFTVASVPSVRTFTYLNPTAGLGNSGGGTVTPAVGSVTYNSDPNGKLLPVTQNGVTATLIATCTPNTAVYPAFNFQTTASVPINVTKQNLVIKMRNASVIYLRPITTAVDPDKSDPKPVVNWGPGGWVKTDGLGYLGFVTSGTLISGGSISDNEGNTFDPLADYVGQDGNNYQNPTGQPAVKLAYSVGTAVGTYGTGVGIVANPTSSKYNITIVPATLTVSGIDPWIEWSPVSITYGTAIGDNQLNAHAFTRNPDLSIAGAPALAIAASPNGATEAGTTVTITTTAANHNLSSGQNVIITGVAVAGYNGGPFPITVPAGSTTTFTYTSPNSGLAASGGGNVEVASTPVAITAATQGLLAITAATETGSIVTLTTATPHSFAAGQQVTVAGVVVAGYNGTFTVVASNSPTAFTYAAAANLTTPTSGGTVQLAAPVVTIAAAAHGFAVGQQVFISGVGVAGYNGAFNIASVPDADHFTITGVTTGLADAGAGGSVATIAGPVGATEAGNTVTITTQSAHGFAVGQHVLLNGIGVGGYNSTTVRVVAAVPTSKSFTITGMPSGLADSGGGIVSSRGATEMTGGDGGSTFSYNVSKDQHLPAGDKELTLTFSPPGSQPSYNGGVVVKSGSAFAGISTPSFTVAKAPLNITLDVNNYFKQSLNPQLFGRTYGDPNPFIDQSRAFYTGFVYGETKDSDGFVLKIVNPNLVDPNSGIDNGNGDVTQSTFFGNYKITSMSKLAAAKNYAVTFGTVVNGTLTGTPTDYIVSKATMSVITDNKTRQFGQPNPIFTGSLSGLKAIDIGRIVETWTVPADVNSLPGTYFITPNIVADSSLLLNYNIVAASGQTQAQQPGVLTITPALLVVTPKNKVISVGKPIPTFNDYSITGLAGTDTVQHAVIVLPTYKAIRPDGSKVVQGDPLGTYQVVVDAPGQALNATYAFSYQTGTLTIGNPVPPIARPDAFARVTDQVLKVLIPKMLANDNDPNGGTISLFTWDATSTHGASITTDGTGLWLYYQAPAGFNTNDTFGYTIINDSGFTATSLVTITVQGNPALVAPKNSVPATLNPDNSITLRFVGVTGWRYKVQATLTFPAVSWDDLPVNALTVDFNNTNNPPPAGNVAAGASQPTWAGLNAGNHQPDGSVLCGPNYVVYKDVDAPLFSGRFYRCIFFSQ